MKSYLTQKDTNVSILASSREGELSYYENATTEKHGRFTLGLLDVLGWDHEANIQRYCNTGNTFLSVRGSLTSLPERYTTTEFYRDIMSIWNKIDPNDFQEPAISFSSKDVVIVPKVEKAKLPQIPTTPQRYIAYVDGEYFETLEEALKYAKNVDEKIYIIDHITLDHTVTIDTTKAHPIDIEFGSYSCTFTEEVEEGFVFTGEGVHEENIGTVNINGGVFETENPDCKTFFAKEDQGVYVTAVSIEGNLKVEETGTINFVAVKKMDVEDIDINDEGVVTIQSGTNMNVDKVKVSDTGEFNITGGTININDLETEDDAKVEISGGTTQFLGTIEPGSKNPIEISGEDTKIAATDKAKEVLEDPEKTNKPDDFEITKPVEPQTPGQAEVKLIKPKKCEGKVIGTVKELSDGIAEVSLRFIKNGGENIENAVYYNWFVNDELIGSTHGVPSFVKNIYAQSSYEIKCEALGYLGSCITTGVADTQK